LECYTLPLPSQLYFMSLLIASVLTDGWCKLPGTSKNKFSKLLQTSVHTTSLVIQYRLATTEGHLCEDCDEQSGIRGSFCKCILLISSKSIFHQSSIHIYQHFWKHSTRLSRTEYYHNFIPASKFLPLPGIWMDSRVRKFELHHSILCFTHTNATAERQQMSAYIDDQWNKR
jgi:hypothetical protein